jgi:hypothetical protein
MHRSALLALLLALPAFLSSSFSARANPLTANETVKLASGHLVKILSISKIEYSKGVMALMVRYQTSLSGDERTAISDEVDDVWKLAQKDIDHDGYAEAILSSNEKPHGIFITASRMWNFLYEKGADGKWTRLNSSDFMAQQ